MTYHFQGGLDYRYAKTLPPVELDVLIEVIRKVRREEEQALDAARKK